MCVLSWDQRYARTPDKQAKSTACRADAYPSGDMREHYTLWPAAIQSTVSVPMLRIESRQRFISPLDGDAHDPVARGPP